MNKLILIPILTVIFLAMDLYAFQALKTVTQTLSDPTRKWIYIAYWSFTAITLGGFFVYHFGNVDKMSTSLKNFLLFGVFANYFSKLFVVLFLFIDDLVRFGRWSYQAIDHYFNPVKPGEADSGIPRAEFLSKVALTAGAIPLVTMAYGVISGAHDYRIRRVTLKLPNLPKAFDGIKVAQLSDIHSGSFFNRTAVKGGIDMLLAEKPEAVFFTGDLVNNKADEVKEYIDIFNKVKAPMGVYSTLGNHDYGDYVQWESQEAKYRNLEKLKAAHKEMGWDLLNNTHRELKIGNEHIAVLGIENYGAKGNFPKYGKLDLAHKGTEDAPVKILLSHDPSHWDAQVNKDYKDIDLMLAGHTHGFQFGIDSEVIKWSPVQYMYKQWGGLYTEGNQHLYVNRGYGYLGYPGRIGMPPEITIIELKCA